MRNLLLISASSFLLVESATAQTTQCQWVGNVWTCNQTGQNQQSGIQWERAVAPNTGQTFMDAYNRARREREEADRARLEAERLTAERDYYLSQTQQTLPTQSQRIVVPQIQASETDSKSFPVPPIDLQTIPPAQFQSQAVQPPRNSSTAQSPQGLDSYDTGNGLLATCQSEQWPICLAFIRGVTQAFAGGLKVAGATQRYCIPPTATMGQTQDVAVKWLIDHPATRHQSADFLVVTALIAAFPC